MNSRKGLILATLMLAGWTVSLMGQSSTPNSAKPATATNAVAIVPAPTAQVVPSQKTGEAIAPAAAAKKIDASSEQLSQTLRLDEVDQKNYGTRIHLCGEKGWDDGQSCGQGQPGDGRSTDVPMCCSRGESCAVPATHQRVGTCCLQNEQYCAAKGRCITSSETCKPNDGGTTVH